MNKYCVILILILLVRSQDNDQKCIRTEDGKCICPAGYHLDEQNQICKKIPISNCLRYDFINKKCLECLAGFILDNGVCIVPVKPNDSIVDIDILNNLPPNQNCERQGLTWGVGNTCDYCKFGISMVSCRGNPLVNSTSECNNRKGDTYCKERRPLLCIKKLTLARPSYNVANYEPYPFGSPGFIEDYNSWSGAFLQTTPPVMGCQIVNRKHADKICEYYFGCDWKMARENDGRYIIGMDENTFSTNFWSPSFTRFPSNYQYYGYGNVNYHNHNGGDVHVASTEHEKWQRFWIYPRFFWFSNATCWNGKNDGFNWLNQESQKNEPQYKCAADFIEDEKDFSSQCQIVPEKKPIESPLTSKK